MVRMSHALLLTGLVLAANSQAAEMLTRSSASVYWKIPLHSMLGERGGYAYGVRFQELNDNPPPVPSIWWRRPPTAEFEFGRNGLEVLRFKGRQVFGTLPMRSTEPVDAPDDDFRLFPHGSLPAH